MQDRADQPASVHDTATAPGDLHNLHELVAKARQNLNQNDWDYIVGGAESETTLRRNRMALDTIAFRPRVLRDVSKVDASVWAGEIQAPPFQVNKGGLFRSFDWRGKGLYRLHAHLKAGDLRLFSKPETEIKR